MKNNKNVSDCEKKKRITNESWIFSVEFTFKMKALLKTDRHIKRI